MKKGSRWFFGIANSAFMRSVVTRILTVFIIVSVVITAVAISSFTSEIRKTVLADKRKQLEAAERAISDRMDEIVSVAYNIGKDSFFCLEPLESDPKSGREMSETLKRYVVGNNFIEHLAFYRLAEPDTIYVSSGERSLSEFFTSSFGMDKETVDWVIHGIQSQTKTKVVLFGCGKNAYFTFVYPLPPLSATPRAFVLMMIPAAEVRPLFESLLTNGRGMAAVYDADGTEIFHVGEIQGELPLAEYAATGEAQETLRASGGGKCVLQKTVSASNGWTYVSVTMYSDTLSGLANKQLAFIVLVLLLLLVAIVVVLASVTAQYRPINRLAMEVADRPDSGGEVLDERALLSHTIATLRDDSRQKQKYETAYYEAEAASQAKSAFLSSMSHDIRTPMNAIVGMTAIARKHIGDREYVDDCLKKVQVASDYLLEIINNVLDMSRIEAGRIPIAEEPVLIPALIDSVVSLMASGVEAKSQSLTVDIGGVRRPAVYGDNIHIVQVFVNIVSNAVKFTPQGGRISITARQENTDDPLFGLYVFTFTDTGVGMPPEFVGQVFDTFTRAEGSVASQTEGTGLGMAIAKNLVELMHGTIRCESELGRGTTFTVELRMKYAEESAVGNVSLPGRPLEESAGVPRLAEKRILLVEDNAMNREIAHRILGETGAEVVEAENGEIAAAMFASQPAGYFDLIFMDIQMPVMNGYEATAAIRAMERPDAATVPIYAMTANTFDEDVRHVKDAGMNGHIGKPYNPAALYKVLSQAFSL